MELGRSQKCCRKRSLCIAITPSELLKHLYNFANAPTNSEQRTRSFKRCEWLISFRKFSSISKQPSIGYSENDIRHPCTLIVTELRIHLKGLANHARAEGNSVS